MLDKNHEQIIGDDLTRVQIGFEQHNPNIILCSKPFHKIEFLDRLINATRDEIIFIDMDLLYTGYVRSEMIQRKEGLAIFCPDKTSWKKDLTEIVARSSKTRLLVIIDSINGMHNMFDESESARFINSCIMLLSSFGNHSKSSVIITGMARRRRDGGLVLFPGGKQIIRSEKTGVYFLEKIKDNLIIRDQTN